MKRSSFSCSAAVLASVLTPVPFGPGPLMAQSTSPQKINVAKLGPQVGEKVPDFELNDQSGETRTLDSVMGPKGAMLVFIRSADW